MEKETGKIPGSLVTLDDGIARSNQLQESSSNCTTHRSHPHRSQAQETRCVKQHQKAHQKCLPPPAAPNTTNNPNSQRRDNPQESQSTSLASKLLRS
ncbi:hypothetical protein QUA42_00155 [Microcoleus sp. Pol11C2]|uniref:hypothetical protein n=1 Tax=Microcoleus sp. Pol11C2 TaxID=3055389 RepID=UPI002FCF3F99